MIQIALCTMLIVSLFFFGKGGGFAEGNSIVIKKGDTLFSISKQYSISVKELKEYNQLSNNTIYVGQELMIPHLKQLDPMYVVIAG
ncbi:LysM peptidoglycan-binding domain-containing protein [Litchfieldia alkalitelluris]|uniref:LysM peptidoglycan-binding domain-containing protein n=1 Tax=Litchfieldia alkalitelluris TaxID=304268 RepID=UPI00195E07B8|nr:LysM peptidoglycan-binding domain-containing protein [Litchfieldia alkalitelluris]